MEDEVPLTAIPSEIKEIAHSLYHAVFDNQEADIKKHIPEEHWGDIDRLSSVLAKMMLLSMLECASHFGSINQNQVRDAITSAWDDVIKNLSMAQQPTTQTLQ
jgi:hypothetical protein